MCHYLKVKNRRRIMLIIYVAYAVALNMILLTQVCSGIKSFPKEFISEN